MALSLTKEQLKSLYMVQEVIGDILKNYIQDGKTRAEGWTPLPCSDCKGTCYNICKANCEGGCQNTCENTGKM